jgi:hypothetical protein
VRHAQPSSDADRNSHPKQLDKTRGNPVTVGQTGDGRWFHAAGAGTTGFSHSFRQKSAPDFGAIGFRTEHCDESTDPDRADENCDAAEVDQSDADGVANARGVGRWRWFAEEEGNVARSNCRDRDWRRSRRRRDRSRPRSLRHPQALPHAQRGQVEAAALARLKVQSGPLEWKGRDRIGLVHVLAPPLREEHFALKNRWWFEFGAAGD